MAFSRIGRLIGKFRELLDFPRRMHEDVRRLERATHADTQNIQIALKQQTKRIEEVRSRHAKQQAELEQEIQSVHAELRDRLLQYHLQLGRLTSLIEGRAAGEPEAYSASIPLSVDVPPPRAPGQPSTEDWLELAHCPACGTADRTIVCKWNKSILLDTAPADDSTIYNYALCHGCGIVYATRRPVGERHRALMDDFPDTIGRDPAGAAANPMLNPYPLSDSDRERYRRMIAGGVFVSDHEKREHLSQVYKDRLENAAHVEILGSQLDLTGARVLEVRSRAGTIVEGLRRHYGAKVMAMPIFESQQLIVRELYGIECSEVIDYDQFTIPFEGVFDLIVCNHMLTHVVRPDRFFNELRAHLRPGGHLYLYNEMDEGFIFKSGRSIVNCLNALHLQTFDRVSLTRVLQANGFEVTFVKRRDGTLLCLARFTDRREFSPPSVDERTTRIAAYEAGRAHAILRAPQHLRDRFAEEWEGAVELAVASGIARFDAKGVLRVAKIETAETSA
jgi:SAM-dependent methyltransferase